MNVYLNCITTALPPHDIHQTFIDYAPTMLPNQHDCKLFKRMVDRSKIEHRYSFLQPIKNPDQLDSDGFYQRHHFPTTQARMQFYEQQALILACVALDKLLLNIAPSKITHLIITSCTGLYAPGLDLQIVAHYGMSTAVERSMISFMGCYAAINALKLARHIVRSDNSANVVIVNIELCTIHLQETVKLEQVLSFLIFGDGCAASLVSAKPEGIELQSFHCETIPDTSDQITWRIGEQGFDMMLSGEVPLTLSTSLKNILPNILGGVLSTDIQHWAIHPGGRTVLDAVKEATGISEELMLPSREVLRLYGNMSSATIMFVLKDMLEAAKPGKGCAMAFGPGLTAETMRFEIGGTSGF